jgi:hypothetical protein
MAQQSLLYCSVICVLKVFGKEELFLKISFEVLFVIRL